MEKILIAILIVVVVGGGIFIASLSGQNVKTLQLIYPVFGEKMTIEETYEISWKSKNINKIGIVLFDGKDPKWIAKDIDASLGKYDWVIDSSQRYGDNYWISIFEYPYSENSKVDYSKGPFSISYVDIISCDSISVEKEWPYIPISFPSTRRVFITKDSYNGNLSGLDGANEICKKEAEKLGYSGEWIAFIGGEKNTETAVERISKSRRGKEGVFILADKDGEISKGDGCHRLLASDFNHFLNLFSEKSRINLNSDENFLNNFLNIWTGRVSESSKASCMEIITSWRSLIPENYTSTVSCQNWTRSDRFIANIFNNQDEESSLEFPICFTPQGSPIEAKGIGGLSFGNIDNLLGIYGKGCDEKKQILCIED